MRKVIVPLVLLALFTARLSAELTAVQIISKVYNRYDGKDNYQKTEMVLIDKNGREKKRNLEAYAKKFGKLRKSYLVFTAPDDIAGTAFLSMENETGDDTQYLYLPELGRSRRIVANQKDGSFVNTDFTYEDMQRRPPEKDNHKLLGSKKISGYDCYIINSVAKDPESSQYSKCVSYVAKDIYIPLKIEYYNKKNELFKVSEVTKLAKIQNIWSVLHLKMENFKENHITTLTNSGFVYDGGVSSDIFSLKNLEKK